MNLRRHKLFLIFLVIVALLGTSVARGSHHPRQYRKNLYQT